ncbi:hypothetical protein DFQ28_009832 [Apophysomyces sp. BC1034]|nr:hypothetical protein DFQ30_009153 [Apophysomyces sp. BC1015]KAG0172436.1 hypothetical protein DFQ29_008399 [Apophysomyces sp. BC1021]KAG0185177.1 hypothetical protein DFQ28_009832 [Apophysomyces sp. BC1034]
MSGRKYDLVVFGASGFTGALTCEYLVEVGDKTLKWAIAGRSLSKLEKVKESLVKMDESAKELDILIADSSNPESLDSVVRDTRVVISTVGPFIKYGTPLVEACMRQKTHYVDITGEYAWIKQIIDRFHEEAKQNHVLIVPACGFDSVPSDLGTFMVAQYMKSKHKLHVADVKLSVTDARGGVSGGTIQSALGAMAGRSISLKRSLDPYLLASQKGIDKSSFPMMRRDHDFGRGKWQAFFIMSIVNEKVVRRSWSLAAERGESYGRLFRYKETMSMSFIPAFLLTAALLTVIPLASILFKIPLFYRLAQKCLPGSGAGPTREQRAKGRFEMQIVANAEAEPYDEPVRVRGTVKGFRDPGYGDTCRMVAESALSIVKSLDQLPGKEGGVLTPATAFGDVLLQRLRKDGGMVFEVQDI